MRSLLSRLKINQNLKIGLLLGVLQFIVYFSGYDHLLRVGPFVAHHFIELPAFYIMGMGFSEVFHDLEWTSVNSQVANLVIFVSNIFLTTIGYGAVSIVAAFIVSSPYLVGFYYHHIITLRKASAEKT